MVARLRLLAADLGITTAHTAIMLVERFYPAGRIAPKTRFGLEALFDG